VPIYLAGTPTLLDFKFLALLDLDMSDVAWDPTSVGFHGGNTAPSMAPLTERQSVSHSEQSFGGDAPATEPR